MTPYFVPLDTLLRSIGAIVGDRIDQAISPIGHLILVPSSAASDVVSLRLR